MSKPKAEAVIRTLLEIGICHGKGYCYPSQNKILKLSRKWSHASMSRRTLNRVLKELERDGWFERVRRHKEGPNGQMEFHSTLYKFKALMYNHVAGLGRLAKRFFSCFRVPKMAQYKPTPESDLSFIGSLSRSIGNGGSKGGAGAQHPESENLASVPAKSFFSYIRAL